MKEISIGLLAQLVQGQVDGDSEVVITGVGKIDSASPGDLVFLANPKYETHLYRTQATAALVSNDFYPTRPVSCHLIRVQDPYLAFTLLLQEYERQQKKYTWGIHPTAFVEDSAKVPSKVSIGPMVYIGPDVIIGEGCVIESHVSIEAGVSLGVDCYLHPGARILKNCQLGHRCVIQSNAVIGSDGFGFAPQPDQSYVPIPQLGNVCLEDDVHIGANCTIDRATLGTTWIRKGTKFDNLIQIAHNVDVGAHTVIAAQAGVAGSVKIGNFSKIGGQVGIAGHVELAQGTQIAAQSGIMKSIKTPNTAWFGSPAFDLAEFLKAYVVFRKLPQLWKDVEVLKKQEPKI